MNTETEILTKTQGKDKTDIMVLILQELQKIEENTRR